MISDTGVRGDGLLGDHPLLVLPILPEEITSCSIVCPTSKNDASSFI